MYGQKKLKSLRQGQTRFQAVCYEAGKVEGYDDQPVAFVFPCFITRVHGMTVYYDTTNGSYICGRNKFLEITQPSFRKAARQAQQLVNEASETQHHQSD